MYEVNANHGGPVPSLPKPDSVTLTIPWEDFVALFIFVATSPVGKAAELKPKLGTSSARPGTDLLPADDLYPLFCAMKPIYTGAQN